MTQFSIVVEQESADAFMAWVDGLEGVRAYANTAAAARLCIHGALARQVHADVEKDLALLESRTEWYARGCNGLEDRSSYYASGDVVHDAGVDLALACAIVRKLQSVLDAVQRSSTP